MGPVAKKRGPPAAKPPVVPARTAKKSKAGRAAEDAALLAAAAKVDQPSKSDGGTGAVKRTGWFRQRFREEYCSVPEFKGWLEAVPSDPYHCWCHLCQCELTVGRSELLKHANAKKHKLAMEEAKLSEGMIGDTNCTSILAAAGLAQILDQVSSTSNCNVLSDEHMQAAVVAAENGEASELEQLVEAGKMVKILETTPSGEVKTTFSVLSGRTVNVKGSKQKPADDLLMSIELRLAAFAVEHNLSGTAIDHLGELIGVLGQRPDLPSKIKLTKRKCVALVKDVLSKSVQQCLDGKLQKTRFSLIVDDSVVQGADTRVVTLLVRYYDDAKNRIHQGLFESFVVREYDEDVLKTIACVFRQRNIPLTNILGIAADCTSIIYRDLELLKKSLFSNNESVVVFSCNHRSITEICTLAVSEAMPNSLQKIARYLGPSAFALQQKADMMQLEGDAPATADMNDFIPRDAISCGCVDPTRWLVEPACVRLLLRHMDALTDQLATEIANFKTPVDEALFKQIIDPYTKAHLMFLNFILTPFKVIQDLFCSEEVVLHRLQKECRAQFRTVCQHFLTPSAYMLGDLATVDPYAEKNLLPVKDVFVGFDCQTQLQHLEPESNELFLMQCRKFLQVATSELQSRIPLSGELLDSLAFLDPDVALKEEGRASMPTLDVELANRIGGFHLDKLREQWQSLLVFFPDNDLKVLRKLPLEVMWGVIGAVRGNNSSVQVDEDGGQDDKDGNNEVANADVLDDNEPIFGQLGRLAKMALSLPITNREVVNLSEVSVELQQRRPLSTAHQRPRQSKETMLRTLATIVPIRHSLRLDSTDCRTMRLTDKHRKSYLLDIAKRTDFDDDPNLFVEDATDI